MWAVPSSGCSVPMVSPGGSVGGGGGGGSKTPAWRRPSRSGTNATATTPPTTSGFIRPPPPPPERRRPGARFCFSRRSRRVVTVTARPEYRPRLDLEMSVRLRFAPSPTGALHIGSVRTILYNYLFARQRGGTLVLRIEDTDRERLVTGAIDSIYDGLHWLGITWDEGPREGGPHAPYVQSERLPLYQRRAAELVAKGAAYYCFCSKERLAELRKQQEARHELTRYDRHCRNIPAAEAAERAKTESHTVRLKVPDEGTLAIDDLVHGRIEWQAHTIENPGLLKSDRLPHHHLALVVDDRVMGITHIMRGEERIASVPQHLPIYRAFGWEVPPMAHVPDVQGPDGKQLSKPHASNSCRAF